MTGRIRVYSWWCGDEICDCVQPVVDVLEYLDALDRRKVRRIAEGPFISNGYGAPAAEEKAAQDRWLTEAREWYCIPDDRTVPAPPVTP